MKDNFVSCAISKKKTGAASLILNHIKIKKIKIRANIKRIEFVFS